MASIPQPRIFVNPPKSKDEVINLWAARLIEILNREFLARPARTEAVAFALLRSDGGRVYSLTVEDDGTLTTTLVQG